MSRAVAAALATGTLTALDTLIEGLAGDLDTARAGGDQAEIRRASRAFLAAIEARGRAEARQRRADAATARTAGREAPPVTSVDELLARRARRASPGA